MKYSPSVLKRLASDAGVDWTDPNMVASTRFGSPVLFNKDGKTVIVGSALSGGKPSAAPNPGTTPPAAIKTSNSYAALAMDSSTPFDTFVPHMLYAQGLVRLDSDSDEMDFKTA